MSFEQIKNKSQLYPITNQDFFRYLQLRQFFTEEVRSVDPTAQGEDVIQVFVQAYKSG